MAHNLIVGMTDSGKTTLAKGLCTQLHKQGKKCIVLDPLYSRWDCTSLTHTQDDFLRHVVKKENYGSYLFVDEGGVAIGRYNDVMNKLATLSRHLGHSSFFIVQRAKLLDTIIVSQCRYIWLFPFAYTYERQMYEQECNIDLEAHIPIKRFHFVRLSRFDGIRSGRVEANGKIFLDTNG